VIDGVAHGHGFKKGLKAFHYTGKAVFTRRKGLRIFVVSV
jgi:hypothetical protein